MKKFSLSADKRILLGRKVKQLRREHRLPANLFGKNVTSLAIEMPIDAFTKVYKEASETGLVELSVGGDKRPVLIQNVQLHPVTQLPLHADFYQVDLKQKVKANVPVEIVGTAAAVDQKLGVLLELVDEIEVEALPTDLPEKIEIDVAKLAHVGDAIKVADLKLPSGVTVLTQADTEIVKIGELVSKEAEALAAEEEAAKAAAAAETAPAPAEGAPTEPVAEGAPAPEPTEKKAPEAKSAEAPKQEK
jgi:large subunit ribosomal protein L25